MRRRVLQYYMLKAAQYLGVSRIASAVRGARGGILALHRVHPAVEHGRMDDVATLSITPETFAAIITHLRKSGVSVVSIDEACEEVQKKSGKGRFVCLTLDDGYRDNLIHAVPVCKSLNVPMCVYVTTSFCDRTAKMWWYALESAVMRNEIATLKINGSSVEIPARTFSQKSALYTRIRNAIVRTSLEQIDYEPFIGTSAEQYVALCDSLALSWDDVKTLADEPLVTVGSHTSRHLVLSGLTDDVLRIEMCGSAKLIQEKAGFLPRHFAYPFGGRPHAGAREYRMAAECGYSSAVTTIPGTLRYNRGYDLMALPRIPVSGLREGRDVSLLSLWMSGII